MRWGLVVLLASAVAYAAPIVEIRARTQLSFGHVRLKDNHIVEVTGTLVDKLTGDGIPGQKVYITVGGTQTWATTETDGSFRIQVAGEPGPQQVTLQYRGGTNARIEPADPLSITTDPARSQVELAVVKIADTDKGPMLRVNGITEDGPVAVPLQLDVASPGKDDWKAVMQMTSSTDFVLGRDKVGGPGMHRLRATFAGDDARQKATAESTIEWTSSTQTTISLSSHRIAYEDAVSIAGKVADEDGKPVARAAVTLLSGDRRLAQGATGDDGTYKFKVEAQIIAGTQTPGETTSADRQFGLQVQADPGQTYVRPSKSNPEVIGIRPPQPVPVSYTIAAFLATVLAAGAFFAARTKPWRRFRRPAPPAEQANAQDEADAPQTGGLVVAKPAGLLPTLRRANDDTFSGVVRETVRGRPIEGAIVKVGDLEVTTGADGGFQIEHLPTGELRAEVSAIGHVTEGFAVTIPHRGELRGVRVDLVPVRERVFQLYRRAAEPILPESRLWGIWSPRQIVDHVRSKRPSPALADLTDFVEEVYFSARTAEQTVLPDANERVDRAIQERTRR